MKELLNLINELKKKYPNDADLGAAIRNLKEKDFKGILEFLTQ